MKEVACPPSPPPERPRSHFVEGLRRFAKNRAAVVSLVFLTVLGLMALLAPWLMPFTFDEQNIAERLEGPSSRHWMGTDSLGRDMYTRIVYGARMSLAVGVLTAVCSLVLGTITGAAAGYWRGHFDRVIMRVVDMFYIFPMLLIAILMTLLFGRGFFGIFAALAVATWVHQARLVRGLFLQAREVHYVEAARAVGASDLSIIARHILPNISAPIIVALTFQIPSNIMAESFLSFIGLGLQPPYSSWGTLANEGFRAMRSYPHLILFPGGILFLAMLAFNYLADGVCDALDPQSAQH